MDQLFEITEYWSFWNKDFPASIPRIIHYPTKLDQKTALIITGARRSGKSTALTQLARHYKLNRKHCVFINFEDPRLIGSLNTELLENLVATFRSKYPPKTKLYFFLDEIQNIPHWPKWLHTKLERPANNYFIITGSNSDLLTPAEGGSLTGRYLSLNIYPFSFEEYLSLFPDNTIYNYLEAGGFPAVLQSSEPENLLLEYFNNIIDRDIIARHSVSHSRTIRQVIKMIYESSGSELSFRKIAGATGLSPDTVSSYVSYGEAAFLLYECPYFTFSERQRVRRNNKYYAIDTRLRRVVATTTGADLGKDFEQIVFYALFKKYNEVYYWKGKREVDFVVPTRTGILPVQVTLEETKERHEKALEEFYALFPDALEALRVNPGNFIELFC